MPVRLFQAKVRGDPWRYFNLLSAPRFSLNAQFLPVPDRFVHGKITDTVLGTLHLATCNAATRHTLGVLFDVFDTTLKCTLLTTPGGAKVSVPCAAELAAAGVTIRRELAGCRLATMECGLALEEHVAAIEAKDASFVRVHMERLNISLAGGVRLSLVRDLVDHPNATEIAQVRLPCPLTARVSPAHIPRSLLLPPARGLTFAVSFPPYHLLLPLSLTAHGSRHGRALHGRARPWPLTCAARRRSRH